MINQFQNENRFLSNFWICTVEIDSIMYASVEHYYQAMKAENPEDSELIRNASVGESKRLGKKIKIRDDWDNIKIEVMQNAVYQKFIQHEDLQQKLLNTFPKMLIEGNHWHDNFWGNCYCNKCRNKKGENRLGLILHELRLAFKIKRGCS